MLFRAGNISRRSNYPEKQTDQENKKNPHFLLIGGCQSWQSRDEDHQEGGIADTGVARLRFTARSQEALWHIEALPAFCQPPPPHPLLHTMHTLFWKFPQIGLCVRVLSQQLKKPACCVKNSKPCYKRLCPPSQCKTRMGSQPCSASPLYIYSPAVLSTKSEKKCKVPSTPLFSVACLESENNKKCKSKSKDCL